MHLIKVKFLRGGVAAGRPYTYETPVKVEVGNLVQVAGDKIAEVVETDVPESEIESFRDKLKSIIGIAKEAGEDEIVTQ